MYVCICRRITDKQIEALCRDGVTSLADVRARLGVANNCGRCGQHAREVVKQFTSQTPFVNAATA